MASDNQPTPLTNFPTFSNLPDEIQTQIWVQAAHNAHGGPKQLRLRLVEFDHHDIKVAIGQPPKRITTMRLRPAPEVAKATKGTRDLTRVCRGAKAAVRQVVPDALPLHIARGVLRYRGSDDIITLTGLRDGLCADSKLSDSLIKSGGEHKVYGTLHPKIRQLAMDVTNRVEEMRYQLGFIYHKATPEKILEFISRDGRQNQLRRAGILSLFRNFLILFNKISPDTKLYLARMNGGLHGDKMGLFSSDLLTNEIVNRLRAFLRALGHSLSKHMDIEAPGDSGEDVPTMRIWENFKRLQSMDVASLCYSEDCASVIEAINTLPLSV